MNDRKTAREFCEAIKPGKKSATLYGCILMAGHQGPHINGKNQGWLNSPAKVTVAEPGDKGCAVSEDKLPTDSTGKRLIPCGHVLQFAGQVEKYVCMLRPGHEGLHSDGRTRWDQWAKPSGDKTEAVHNKFIQRHHLGFDVLKDNETEEGQDYYVASEIDALIEELRSQPESKAEAGITSFPYSPLSLGRAEAGELLPDLSKFVVGSPIWGMVEQDDTIGLRLDCGDGGTLKLTPDQARQVTETLQDLLGAAHTPEPIHQQMLEAVAESLFRKDDNRWNRAIRAYRDAAISAAATGGGK